MPIIRNSAKCVHCDEEIESVGRHSFVTHYCSNKPRVDSENRPSMNFFVDGGKAYLRRGGYFEDMIDTSIETE